VPYREMFAMDNWGVVPDILTTAKGITNAAVPLGLPSPQLCSLQAPIPRNVPDTGIER
jgi:hypothetical protein